MIWASVSLHLLIAIFLEDPEVSIFGLLTQLASSGVHEQCKGAAHSASALQLLLLGINAACAGESLLSVPLDWTAPPRARTHASANLQTYAAGRRAGPATMLATTMRSRSPGCSCTLALHPQAWRERNASNCLTGMPQFDRQQPALGCSRHSGFICRLEPNPL